MLTYSSQSSWISCLQTSVNTWTIIAFVEKNLPLIICICVCLHTCIYIRLYENFLKNVSCPGTEGVSLLLDTRPAAFGHFSRKHFQFLVCVQFSSWEFCRRNKNICFLYLEEWHNERWYPWWDDTVLVISFPLLSWNTRTPWSQPRYLFTWCRFQQPVFIATDHLVLRSVLKSLSDLGLRHGISRRMQRSFLVAC